MIDCMCMYFSAPKLRCHIYWMGFVVGKAPKAVKRIRLVGGPSSDHCGGNPCDGLDCESKCWARFDFRFNIFMSHMGAGK
jgi:hypothetical protein